MNDLIKLMQDYIKESHKQSHVLTEKRVEVYVEALEELKKAKGSRGYK